MLFQSPRPAVPYPQLLLVPVVIRAATMITSALTQHLHENISEQTITLIKTTQKSGKQELLAHTQVLHSLPTPFRYGSYFRSMLLKSPPRCTPRPSFCWKSPVNKQKKAAQLYTQSTRHPSEIWCDPSTHQSMYAVWDTSCFSWVCPWQGYNSSLRQLDHHRVTQTQWGGECAVSVPLFGNQVPDWAERSYLCLSTSTPSAMNSTYGFRQPQVPV